MTKDKCPIDRCELLVWHNGFCRKHNTIYMVYGDPLALGDSEELTARQIFIKNALKQNTDECISLSSPHGYPAPLRYLGKQRTLISFICELVHGARPSDIHVAAHSCGNGRFGCINWKHLSWKTTKENNEDKVIHGTSNIGKRWKWSKNNKRRKLKEERISKMWG
jgi:hypothetical protein